MENPSLRLVERVVLHEGPIPFSTLAERVVPEGTRALVMDLDRTVHLGRNMGELLGWELSMLRAFGPDELAAMEADRGPGRLIVDPHRLRGSLRYLREGLRTWATPGLYYLFFGKLPVRAERSRRLSFRVFGDEPVRAVQRVPQTVLLELMRAFPTATLRELAARIWDRHGDDQVVRREHIDALRAAHPGLRVILTSASPRVVVEVAGERLGVDAVEGSEPGQINSGPAKIARLRARMPELFAPGAGTVGLTDTGYGEDHCWADHLGAVVDLNSDAPFSPVVAAGSPVTTIHSAQAMTLGEERARARGERDWMDERRPVAPRRLAQTLERPEIERRVAGLLDEALGADSERAWHLDFARREARRRLEAA